MQFRLPSLFGTALLFGCQPASEQTQASAPDPEPISIEAEISTSGAYLYWFTFVPPVENSEQYRAFHAGELGYVFGNLDLFGAKPTDADYEFSDLMASIWTQFAKTGNPNGEGLPQWPAYSSDTEAYMESGVNTGSRAELRIRQMDVIEIGWATRRSNAAVDSEDGQP